MAEKFEIRRDNKLPATLSKSGKRSPPVPGTSDGCTRWRSSRGWVEWSPAVRPR